MSDTGVVTQTNSTDIPRFMISGEINDELCKEFLSFHTISVRSGVTEALLYINSPGGSVTSLATIAGILQNGEVMYHTIAMGQACSAACILTAFGSFRWAVQETVFLFHDASFGTYGNLKQLEETIETQKVFCEKMIEKFSKHTNKAAGFWLDMAYSRHNSDYYFDATQALEYGVVDFIGMPTIGRQSQYVVELPVEMDEFEEILKRRGVHTEEVLSKDVPKKRVRKTKSKTPIKRKTKTK